MVCAVDVDGVRECVVAADVARQSAGSEVAFAVGLQFSFLKFSGRVTIMLTHSTVIRMVGSNSKVP